MRFKTIAIAAGLASAVAVVTGLLLTDTLAQITTNKVVRECGGAETRESMSDECALRVRAVGHMWSQKGQFAAALPWYERGAASSDRIAMFHLAWTYEQVDAQDQAQRWYETAAENGFTPAMINLADRLIFGTGTQKDRDQALRWFVKASTHGNPIAGRNMFAHNAAGTGFTDADGALRGWAEQWIEENGYTELDPADLKTPTFERTRLMGKPVSKQVMAETSAEQKARALIEKMQQDGRPSSVANRMELSRQASGGPMVRPFTGVTNDTFNSPARRLDGP